MSRVATRYAKALIDLAFEQGNLEVVHSDIQSFLVVTKNEEFAALLKSPIIKADKKQSILTALFANRLSTLTNAFFEIITRKGRESFLIEIAHEFNEQYKAIKNISTVTLTTATPVSPAILESIKAKLERSTATKTTVEIETKVNADIIGGFTLEFQHNLYDASIANQLKQMKKEFSKNTYIKNF